MDKVLSIIRREYVVRVKTRAFVISTIASPLLMLALTVLPIFFVTRGGGERQVTVLDQSGDQELFETMQKGLTGRGDSAEDPGPGRTNYRLTRVAVALDADIEQAQEPYKLQAEKNPDSTYLILRPGILTGVEPEYYAQNTSDFSISNLRRAISDAVIGVRLKRAGLDQSRINDYTKPISLKTRKISTGGEVREGGRMDFLVSFVMLFFMYITVLFYGLFVMRGVIEEKQSRIVEVIVSSVKPTQLLLGKVIGIGLVGLTQMGVWVLSAYVLTTVGVKMFASSAVSAPNLPPSLLIYFMVFFLLGYFLYATLYALVGATVSNEEDAQQAQFPVTTLLVVPMIVINLVLANPNSAASITLSMIPFFAPIIMMMRIGVVNPPFWQILLSMGIMLATILGCVWLAARIYRVGILMYGKRPSLSELGKWLRYT